MAGDSKTCKNGHALTNEDLLQNILERLPAVSFASAACVSKSWNFLCNRVLSRPKFASALSFNPSFPVAAKEVLDKVLSKPIRPHFVIVKIGSAFGLRETLKLMEKELGSQTPIVVSSASGIMGRDALTNEFKEVKWGDLFCGSEEHTLAYRKDVDCGILLSISYVPGLKVDVIPLIRPTTAPQAAATVDKFVMDIRDYTSSVSGCTSPVGIIMFGESSIDMKLILDKLDYAMPLETFIMGNERCHFIYKCANASRNIRGTTTYFTDAVALVFARERHKSSARVRFHAALSTGVSTVGPRYKAVAVRTDSCDRTTWLTAKREGEQEILDGQTILDYVNDELENRIESPDLYIGVTKRRNCSIGSEKTRSMTSMAFHSVVDGGDEYLYVDGVGIRTGDFFQFYCSDPNTAFSSCDAVSSSFKKLKMADAADSSVKEEVFGGFIFTCYGRGEFDTAPILENFPDLPLAGVYCGGEIGRVRSSSSEPGKGDGSVPCYLHIYSTVYLLMSFSEH